MVKNQVVIISKVLLASGKQLQTQPKAPARMIMTKKI